MRKSVPVALVLVAVLLFMTVGPVMADPIDDIIGSEKISNGEVSSLIINLASIAQGTISSAVYHGVYEQVSIQNFNVTPQEPLTAKNKLTRFIFNLHAQYQVLSRLIICNTGTLNTVDTYVYGQHKTQFTDAIVCGLTDCLNNDIDDSWLQKYYPENWLPRYSQPTGGSSGSDNSTKAVNVTNTVQLTTTTATNDITHPTKLSFNIGESIIIVDGKTIKMDVNPYIKNNRTFLAVRHLLNTLRIPDNNIKWDPSTQKIMVISGNTTIRLFVDFPYLFINDKAVKMDVKPEIKNGRTMLPIRWITEALGYTVNWDKDSQQVTIEKPGD